MNEIVKFVETIAADGRIWGTLGASGGFLFLLWKKGIVTFAKGGNGGNGKGCPDRNCQDNVLLSARDIGEIKADVAELKRTIGEKLFPKLDQLATDSARICGYLDGWQGGQASSPKAGAKATK